MSTSFDVYPTKDIDLIFGNLLSLANENMRVFFAKQSVDSVPEVLFEVRSKSSDKKVSSSLDDSLKIPEEHYIWFYVHGVEGGCDAYFWESDDSDYEEIYDSIASLAPDEQLAWKDMVVKAASCGVTWNFNRSAGQPSVINIMYGVLAASMGQLNDGVIYSGDCAWDSQRFPAKGDDFLTWYFNPETAIDPDFKSWSKECINELRTGN